MNTFNWDKHFNDKCEEATREGMCPEEAETRAAEHAGAVMVLWGKNIGMFEKINFAKNTRMFEEIDQFMKVNNHRFFSK